MSDAEFLLAVLSERPGEWTTQKEIIDRSTAERGCGLTVHSRASTLRNRGHQVENKVERQWNPETQTFNGRAISSYRLVSLGSPASEPQTTIGDVDRGASYDSGASAEAAGDPNESPLGSVDSEPQTAFLREKQANMRTTSAEASTEPSEIAEGTKTGPGLLPTPTTPSEPPRRLLPSAGASPEAVSLFPVEPMERKEVPAWA